MYDDDVFKYCFIDEFGNEYLLTIDCNGRLGASNLEYVAPEKDLQTNAVGYSISAVGRLFYRYGGYGELDRILWEDDLYQYSLALRIEDPNKGFAGELLSLETAEAAGERLISIFNGDLRIQNTVRTAILVGGGIAVVGSLAAVLLLRKKKK